MVDTVVHFMMLFISYEKCIPALIKRVKRNSPIYPCGQMLVCMVSGFVHDLDVTNSTYLHGFCVLALILHGNFCCRFR